MPLFNPAATSGASIPAVLNPSPDQLGYAGSTFDLTGLLSLSNTTIVTGTQYFAFLRAVSPRAAGSVTLAYSVGTAGATVTSALFNLYVLSGGTFTQIGVSADASAAMATATGKTIAIPTSAALVTGASLLIGVRISATTMPQLQTGGFPSNKFPPVRNGAYSAVQGAAAALPTTLTLATYNASALFNVFAFGLY